MATLERAAQANQLIRRLPRLNNQAIAALNGLRAIQDLIDGLTTGERNEVIAAIGDLGFSAGELQGILTSWMPVHAEMLTQGPVNQTVPE